MASISLQVQPFTIPQEVTVLLPTSGKRTEGVRPLPTIKLSELSDDVLAALIEEFAASVMLAARPE